MITPVSGVLTVSDEVVDEPATSKAALRLCDGGELADPDPSTMNRPICRFRRPGCRWRGRTRRRTDSTTWPNSWKPTRRCHPPTPPRGSSRGLRRPRARPPKRRRGRRICRTQWSPGISTSSLSADPAIAVCCVCASTDITRPPSFSKPSRLRQHAVCPVTLWPTRTSERWIAIPATSGCFLKHSLEITHAGNYDTKLKADRQDLRSCTPGYCLRNQHGSSRQRCEPKGVWRYIHSSRAIKTSSIGRMLANFSRLTVLSILAMKAENGSSRTERVNRGARKQQCFVALLGTEARYRGRATKLTSDDTALRRFARKETCEVSQPPALPRPAADIANVLLCASVRTQLRARTTAERRPHSRER